MKKSNTVKWLDKGKLILFYVSLLLIWQLMYWLSTDVLGWWKPYAFPNPYSVYLSCLKMVRQNQFWPAVFSSLRRALAGYLLSLAFGGVLGVGMTRYRWLRRCLKSLFLGIQTLPSICWVPFAILLFGLKDSAILFVVVMGSAAGIALSVVNAFTLVDSLYIKAALSMGVKGLDLYRRVILPSAVPALIGGLRQGWSFAWRALMAGEVMSATVGLGQALTMGRDYGDINRVMFLMLVIVILGMTVDIGIFSQAEKRAKARRGLLVEEDKPFWKERT